MSFIYWSADVEKVNRNQRKDRQKQEGVPCSIHTYISDIRVKMEFGSLLYFYGDAKVVKKMFGEKKKERKENQGKRTREDKTFLKFITLPSCQRKEWKREPNL